MPIVTQIDLLKNRRTKIIATLGPASRGAHTIRRLISAGVNLFRLNMSHGDHDSHRRIFEHVRNVAEEMKAHVAVLADLCGPKIRTGRFRDGRIELAAGDKVTVTTRPVTGEPGLVPSQYEALARDLQPGNRILLDDGNLEFKVEAVKGTEIACTVVSGGVLRDNKGINLPGVNVSAPSLTSKDRDDARFALALGVDFLALSFVRRAADVDELRALIADSGRPAAVIAKIEKPEALQNTDAILDSADGIMIARGDLGVELSPEYVPVAQQQLIDRARARNRPVIVATQMLESMIDHPRPTRAEVTDISHAVNCGVDAVMLSAETAAGRYPIEAVEMMARIARQTEAYIWRESAFGAMFKHVNPGGTLPWGDAIADATARLSFDLRARAVMVLTHQGMTAATVSSARPAAPVVAVSGDPGICRRLGLLWGVIPVLAADVGSANPNQVARRVAQELELAGPGDHILLVRGFHSDPELNTPSITVLQV